MSCSQSWSRQINLQYYSVCSKCSLSGWHTPDGPPFTSFWRCFPPASAFGQQSPTLRNYATGSACTVVGRFLLLARLSGTHCPKTFGIRSVVLTVTDSRWRHFYFRSTSVFSAIEVFLRECAIQIYVWLWHWHWCMLWVVHATGHWSMNVSMMRCSMLCQTFSRCPLRSQNIALISKSNDVNGTQKNYNAKINLLNRNV